MACSQESFGVRSASCTQLVGPDPSLAILVTSIAVYHRNPKKPTYKNDELDSERLDFMRIIDDYMIDEVSKTRKKQGRCDGGVQRWHRNESRIRYEADTTLRIYVLGVFAMCTKCKFRDE